MQDPARRRRSGAPLIAAALWLLMTPAGWAAGAHRNTVYDTLLTQLEGILRDLDNFDAIVTAPSATVQPDGSALQLPAPAPVTIPQGSAPLTVQRRVQLSLSQALALAVSNNPALAESVSNVARERAMLRAAWGRYAPTLSLSLGALGAQRLERSEASYRGWMCCGRRRRCSKAAFSWLKRKPTC